jgi:hypothetical protein
MYHETTKRRRTITQSPTLAFLRCLWSYYKIRDAFALMGESDAQLMRRRMRLQSDAAYFDEWIIRIHDWHGDVLTHLQQMRDDGYIIWIFYWDPS